ncbi:hypothetical protein B0F90DRAFT_1735375 [Multifurca ochricompacta]|uniref:ENTH domain-containing protein n=1 Tax=Multifurca ochricompacta TaxID=376703 RepID=A0AAD4QM91_9AGAM|nr:hypothetical protein B0F90DRAFT_1735375 [Multifurca ochricompacta]
MDRLESLGNTLSNLTMYDIKSMYNQAKNVVLNVSEMEAKVREATNDDPWGASSTLMQEIAQGTFNFQQFNEIMPCIYSQFMEKEARQWRQIYKALQLLEYLVKHGSERVVDDGRSHVSTLKMLRSFHYIDEKGKDQGINVRNRAKELVELLADVDKIRQERKKAKANRSKYVGSGNDGFGGGRYGGFGNDSLGGGGGYSGDYGTQASGYDRGGFLPIHKIIAHSSAVDYSGGGSSSGFRDIVPRRPDFEEYDAGEYETSPRRTTAPSTTTAVSQTASTRPPTTQSKAAGKAPEPAPAPVMNLLDFDDNESAPASSANAPVAAATVTSKALPALAPLAANDNAGGDDDFADFQAAPSSPPAASTLTATPSTAPATTAKPNLMDLLASTAPAPSPATYRPTQNQPFGMFNTALSSSSSQVRPSSTPATAPAYMATPVMNPTSARSAMTSPVSASIASSASSAATSKKSGGGGFDDLWTLSLGAASASKPAAGLPSGAGKSIRDLEKEKAQVGIWGGAQSQVRPSAAMSGFGAFAKPAASSSGGSAPAGADDLLL